jgi:hypothetical protein
MATLAGNEHDTEPALMKRHIQLVNLKKKYQGALFCTDVQEE